MKLSSLKTAVYIGLALFYLYIIATNVFRNVEGMNTQIETMETPKEDESKAGETKEDKTKDGETNAGESKEGESKAGTTKEDKSKKDETSKKTPDASGNATPGE
jgi:hypothetical protein